MTLRSVTVPWMRFERTLDDTPIAQGNEHVTQLNDAGRCPHGNYRSDTAEHRMG